MLREKCNRPMLLIERQRAMLLEVYKCIHELGLRYRHGMFSQKCRAYDYRDPLILTLPKYVLFKIMGMVEQLTTYIEWHYLSYDLAPCKRILFIVYIFYLTAL